MNSVISLARYSKKHNIIIITKKKIIAQYFSIHPVSSKILTTRSRWQEKETTPNVSARKNWLTLIVEFFFCGFVSCFIIIFFEF